jgi:molybdopterin converting factor small subunit
MMVRVLLFGAEAAAVGRSEIDIHVDPPVTPASLLSALGREHAPLRPTVGACRVAVNHRFASTGHEIAPGDEVALIGLVSGG